MAQITVLQNSPKCPTCHTEPPWDKWEKDLIDCGKCHETFLNIRPTDKAAGYISVWILPEEDNR